MEEMQLLVAPLPWGYKHRPPTGEIPARCHSLRQAAVESATLRENRYGVLMFHRWFNNNTERSQPWKVTITYCLVGFLLFITFYDLIFWIITTVTTKQSEPKFLWWHPRAMRKPLAPDWAHAKAAIETLRRYAPNEAWSTARQIKSANTAVVSVARSSE